MIPNIPGFRQTKPIPEKEKIKRASRYIAKIREFSILNIEQLREKAKDKMSSTDRQALEDVFRDKMTKQAEETLTKEMANEAAKEIFDEVNKTEETDEKV